METVLAIVALLFLLFVVTAAVATVKVAKVAKRSVDRTVGQARRSVEESTLRARRLTQPGVSGELAGLRLRLRTSMRATQDALRGAAGADSSLSEALGLFERLSDHGHTLDDELRRLEREPDRTRVQTLLPELRERTDRIVTSADSLRWAARDRARTLAEDDLAALGAQIDVEAGALRDWHIRGSGPLGTEPGTAGDGATTPRPGAGPTGPGAGVRDAAKDEAGGAGEDAVADGRSGTSGPPAGGPRALGPRERTAPTAPWQKAPRPDKAY
ncbi:hypothetical protein ACFV3R_03050 [Streptomyces sp. NPDC059740]|uniref:hypothetical protein n=1 Tax=Streptomyces sp. NPDC059740 TaxID=3346926 RepID=UPI00364EAA60